MDTEIMKTLSLISTNFTTKSIVYCEEPNELTTQICPVCQAERSFPYVSTKNDTTSF